MAWRTAFAAVVLLASAAAGGERIEGRAEAIDGDSICLGVVVDFHCRGRVEIRLAGGDALEGRQDCTGADGRPWACGVAARERLAALLAAGPVTCEGVGRSYHRLVARCRTADGRDPLAVLVAEGLAVDDARFAPDYAGTEAAARAARRGAWAGRFVRPAAWRSGKR